MSKQQKLLSDSADAEMGISNPSLVSSDETLPVKDTADKISDENEAESLLHNLSARRRRKQKELTKTLKTNEDLAEEVRTVKQKSRKALEESLNQSAGTTSLSMTQDSTLPIPSDWGDTVDGAPVPSTTAGPVKPILTPRKSKRVKVLQDVIEDDGEQRDDVQDMKEKPVLQSSMSIRNRIKTLREKAKSEAASEVNEEVRKQRKTLFEENERMSIMLEDRDIEKRTTETLKKLHQKRKDMKLTPVQKNYGKLTAKQAADFFTHMLEEEGEIPIPSSSQTIPEETRASVEESEAEIQSEETYEEDTALLIDSYEEDEFGLFSIVKSDMKEYQKQIDAEAKIYCRPSSRPVPSLEKLDPSLQEPRYLIDEGFYVGTPPNIASSNRNRMEQRLMLNKEQGKKWFGEDGRIKSLPDPLKKISSRVPMPEEQELDQHTLYRKAILKEFDSRYIDGMVENKGRYQLDIDINTLSLSHHHLFSKEHVLVTKLLSLYQEYLIVSKNNMVEFLTEKLKAAKNSARYLQDQLLKQKSILSEEDVLDYEKRLQDYLLDISHIRSQRDKDEEINQNLLKNIIQTWKQIKTQRERQGFINTTVKLLIHRQEVDRAQDDLQWRQEIEDEVEELRAVYNNEYEKQWNIYQKDLEDWEIKQRLKKEALKRQKNRGRKKSKNTADPVQTLNTDDEEILSDENGPKPILPENFDERGAREKIRSKALKIRRRPGDPKLFPEVLYTANITPSHQCPKSEQRRQDDVLKYKIFVKILFNNKEVLRTNSKPLTQDFKVTFGQIYNLKIVQWPESVALQIYEHTGFTSHQLTEIYLNIPESSVTCTNVDMEDHEFSCDLKIQFNHEGVGSGVAVNFDSNSENILFLNTSGILSCSLAWAVDDKGVPLVPPVGTNILNKLYSACSYLDPLAAIGVSGINDREQLSKWVESSRLDPNDPNNADLIYALKPQSDPRGKQICPDYFRLEQFQEEFNFCFDEDISQNKRFQLLKLRDREISEFSNFKMVPSIEKEIPKNIFRDYEQRKKEENKVQIMEDLETKCATVTRYIQRIREEVMLRFRIASHRKRREEVINEDAVPNIGMIGESLLSIFKSKHPLKPDRKERKRIAQGIKGDEVKILVNVIQAFNIPVRDNKTIEMTNRKSSNMDAHGIVNNLYREQTVHPYLEVSFQRNTVRTRTADGPNPSFNEELIVPFHAKNNNFTANNLQTVSDILFFNLFDEVLVDILEDDTKQDTEIHQRVERKWLGSLKIPFSTIYFNGKVDGTMHLRAPPLLLGYTYTHNTLADIDAAVIPVTDTYLTLFITIQPTLIPPEPIKEMFSSSEDEKLLQYCKNWQIQLESKWPSRAYKTTVIDITGKSVFITRFFKALVPPIELTEGKAIGTATEMILRYVSLIPYVADNFILPGHCDIWSTCDQFLHMLVGDDEEHSVLLTNFLLGIGKKAWLCIGTGIPDGLSAYVVTAEGNNNYFIWDAKNGKVYNSKSNHIPLQNVGSMINHENIWANIQSTDIPPRISFNVNDSSFWRPFFHSGYPNPKLTSVQVDTLSYVPTDSSYVLDLQEKIEKTLKTKVTEWRRKYLTRWNRYFTQNIRSLLHKLEDNRESTLLAEHLNEMEHQWGSYKVSGFPINLPFTELKNIVEFVYATGVHKNDASSIEFALAVYIHAYPNNVLSVWIYIASLIKQR